MFDQLTKHADAPARVLMSAIFILSGMSKVSAFAATQGYMDAFGVPGILLAPTILFEVVGGVLLFAGFLTRYIAFLLAGFSLVTALVFHTAFGDETQLIMFLKNLAMAGGFLLLAKTGAPGFSVDGWLAARKGA